MTFYKFGVGVVLAVAMVSVLAGAALVFSARDFQYGVAQIADNTNGLISFERLAAAENQIAKIEAESAGPRGEYLELSDRIAAIDSTATDAATSANSARESMVGVIATIEQRGNVQAGASAAVDTSTQGLSQRINTLAARPGLSPQDQQSVAALRTQVQTLAAQEASAAEGAENRADLALRLGLVEGQVSEANRRIYALQETVVPNRAFYERVRGEAEALKNLSPLGVSAYLAQGHPSLLSTILVLLMGALGALLYLFPAYLNRAQPVTMAEIAVRLIFGMCAALALYVLANAAVSSFSFGTPTAGQVNTAAGLNPFTVSLFGIVAGVLSEDIAKWIQDRGRGIFTQGGTPASGADLSFTGVNPHGGPDAP